MKVLLIDADGVNGFPNLALMKLSAWYNAQGDHVDLIKGIPTTPPLERYDKALASCVFFQNRESVLSYLRLLDCPWELGGSGYDLETELPYEIEHSRPDYGLYPTPFSIGFTSRGCIRKCGFCIVQKKEGHIRDNAPISEFHNPDHDRLVLLDNNFLASPKRKENLAYIREQGLSVNFNQGLDARLITWKVAEELASIKLYAWRFKTKGFHIAFDSPISEKAVRRAISNCANAGIRSYRIMCYVLVGFDTTLEQDLDRVMILKEIGAIPFVMVYNKTDNPVLWDLARWVNRKYYQFIDWKDYKGRVKCG